MNNLYGVILVSSSIIMSTPCWSICFDEGQAERTKPDSIYAEHGDGTVTDLETGLMWSKCEVGKSGENCEMGESTGFTSWESALQYASGSELAGYDDWRMPNIKELDSLTESSCSEPAINTTVFDSAISGYFWSSTVTQGNAASYTVWVVRGDGHIQTVYKNPTGGVYLRLVRFQTEVPGS